jgi:hypothetical protein
MSSYKVFQKGNTIIKSKHNGSLHIQIFSQVLKGKYPLAMSNIKSSKQPFCCSFCFLYGEAL